MSASYLPISHQPPPSATPSPLLPAHVAVAGHDLTVFVESLPLLTAMILDIRSASHRIWLETYIFHDDGAGRAIAEVLKFKARQGVETRVLYDSIGSQLTPESFFDEMRE